jgi:hypothetical protein
MLAIVLSIVSLQITSGTPKLLRFSTFFSLFILFSRNCVDAVIVGLWGIQA